MTPPESKLILLLTGFNYPFFDHLRAINIYLLIQGKLIKYSAFCVFCNGAIYVLMGAKLKDICAA